MQADLIISSRMLALPRCPQILLLLPISLLALLLLQECAAASSVGKCVSVVTQRYACYVFNISSEMHSPTSQVIVLGDSATFNCSVTDIRDYSFRWEYTNDIDDAARFVDHSIRPPVGISITNNTSRPIVFTITFEGRKEFNNIELFCTLWTFGNIIRSDPATLIVIGKYTMKFFEYVHAEYSQSNLPYKQCMIDEIRLEWSMSYKLKYFISQLTM